jgi:hypothetical protein
MMISAMLNVNDLESSGNSLVEDSRSLTTHVVHEDKSLSGLRLGIVVRSALQGSRGSLAELLRLLEVRVVGSLAPVVAVTLEMVVALDVALSLRRTTRVVNSELLQVERASEVK